MYVSPYLFARIRRGYEIIDGHRRYRASELAEYSEIPVIIRDLSDEEAVSEMVDGNVYRENVLPSERAWAYRMYLEAEKAGGTTCQNLPKISANFRSDDEIGKSLGISGDTLRNYIQLTELRQELMDKVDTQEIGFICRLSVCRPRQRRAGTFAGCNGIFAEYTVTLSGPAAEKSQQGRDTYAGDNAGDAFRGEKTEAEKLTFSTDTIRKYFPRSYTPKRMQETIIKLLEAWQKKRQRSQDR